MTEDQTPGKLRETSVSPPTPGKSVLKAVDNDSKEEELTASEEAVSTDAIIHGVPLMMYKCKFQAHLARIDSVQDARAVFRAVSSQIAKEAGLREYVCPFAFRLSCEGTQKTPLRLEEPPTEKQGHESLTDEAAQEGFCDNDDVGSGERLLYLLQNWDVKHGVVLVVSRINGGFMMAELLGIRRYKFIVDRAKRLLENSVLAGADSNPATAGDSCIGLPFREALANGQRYHSAYRTPDKIDTQALPGTMRQFSSARQTRDEWPIGRQLAGRRTTPQRNVFQSGRTSNAWQANERVAGATRTSTRNRERQPLSLARLRISSDTVGFPQGHVPSMMGDRGYGVKRGRINHFEFPTPGRDSVTAGLEEAIICPKGLGYEDGSGDPNPRDARRQIARPCVPLAATTGLRKGGHNMSALGGNTSARKIHASSQSTIESCRDRFEVDGRNSFETESSSMTDQLSAIIAGVGCGVSEDHPLCPPPPSAEEVGQNRGEDGLDHNGLLSAAGGTVDESNKEPSCDFFPVKTSDASSSGCGGREFRHQAPLSASLGTTVVSRAGELSITHGGDDGNDDAGKGSPCQTPAIFQGIHGKSLSRREDDDYEVPVRRGSGANGLPLPTIGKA